ncbi:MAG: hypothetical protein U0768_04000 [Anaerolineae bacterium]
MPAVQQAKHDLIVTTDAYRLQLDARDGTWADLARGGVPVARLYLPGAVDTLDGHDVTLSVSAPTVKVKDNCVRVTVRCQSSLWGARVVKLRCYDDVIHLDVRVQGDGAIDTVRLFSGWTAAGPAHSSLTADLLFTPGPTDRYSQYLPPNTRAIISASEQADGPTPASFFAPAPLCFCIRASEALWLGFAACPEPGDLTFEDYVFEGHGGFELGLTYSGHTRAQGEWTSPAIALVSGADEYDTLEMSCMWRNAAGTTPCHNGASALWWHSPIFSGWGEQMALAAVSRQPGRAADFCTQSNYEDWLGVLAAHDLNPGIVIVEQKWQSHYGDPWPDPARWPDMAGFIQAQHAAGRRVILSWKAWDAEGVPPGEHIQDDGELAHVDPTQPDYWQRLQTRVERLIGDLDADGLKIDAAHLTPHGPRGHAHARTWGIELLRDLVAHLSDAAKSTKEDALIIAQTTDPYFANIVDMISLNGLTPLQPYNVSGAHAVLTQLTHRARVARAACRDWLVAADGWPCLDRAQWLSYIQRQPYLGVPTLSFATRIDSTGEALRPEDYAAVANAWKVFRRSRVK